ncbi:MAG: xylulokinase [Thermoanaerobaculia bacterium]|nr:xylulokinase [Thermoanaerobaculia bacterium]
MSYFLGIDVSTTATKAVVVDSNGAVVVSASSAYDLSIPRSLWAEQDPALWWRACRRAIGEALDRGDVEGEAIAGIGLTGQMHGLVLLDERGRVVRPAILWNDQRAEAECSEIRDRVGREELLRITGNDAFAGFSAPKLLWVRRHETDLYRRVRRVLLPKDYVRYRLSGEFATDRAGAGGTLLLDLQRRDWSAELLEALDIPLSWLPPTHEGTEVTGRVSPEGAEATGIAAGTPIVAGGGDQAAQAVGVGAVEPGVVAVTLGTSGVVFATSERPLIDAAGRLHAFPHAVPDRWHLMGVMLSAAGSLRWYRDVVAPGLTYETLIEEAEAVPPGSDGLTFLPYLSGERTPHADSAARGAFVGLTLRHGRPEMTRAVLEGVGFGLRDSLELIEGMGVTEVTEARISGGGARSPIWRQMLADQLGIELVGVATTEGAGFGAALLAGVGCGNWPSVPAACEAAVEIATMEHPRIDLRSIYDALHASFERHYPALAPLFRDAE